MFSGFFGWHLLIIVGTLAVMGLLAWSVYWLTNRAARVRRDAEEQARQQVP